MRAEGQVRLGKHAHVPGEQNTEWIDSYPQAFQGITRERPI